jgi:hypothetical protein
MCACVRACVYVKNVPSRMCVPLSSLRAAILTQGLTHARFSFVCCKSTGILHTKYIGLAITIYIRCIHSNIVRDFVKFMVIYGVDTRFWPTLIIHKALKV